MLSGVLSPPLQLGDNSMMQAVLKMGDGVSNTPRRAVPQELQHPHSKVRADIRGCVHSAPALQGTAVRPCAHPMAALRDAPGSRACFGLFSTCRVDQHWISCTQLRFAYSTLNCRISI